jgi:hypothetical protein
VSGLLLALMLAAPDCAADPSAQGCALWLRTDPAAQVDRPRLEEIYSRPEFARARLRNQGTIEQLLRRLRQWFESFFESKGAASYSEITRFLVLFLAAIAALWAVLRLLSKRGAGRAVSVGAAVASTALTLDDPLAHLARARSQLTADPRVAIREGLLALLSVLERRRLARPDRVKTNRELGRELPARGAPAELTARVESLLGWYDRTFYSLEAVPPAEAARFLDDVEQLSRG